MSAIPEQTRLVYVTPSHQFPLGMSMSLNRRRQLLDWADHTGAVIIEDDFDSEFRFAGCYRAAEVGPALRVWGHPDRADCQRFTTALRVFPRLIDQTRRFFRW